MGARLTAGSGSRVGGLNCSAACDCACALRSSIFASPKMMYVSEAGLLNTSGAWMTNRICAQREQPAVEREHSLYLRHGVPRAPRRPAGPAQPLGNHRMR